MLIHRILHTVLISCVYQKMGVRACRMKALLSQAVALLPSVGLSVLTCWTWRPLLQLASKTLEKADLILTSPGQNGIVEV